MFRISPDLKEEVKRRAEENNCTMTSYIEFLIVQDIEDNPAPPKKKFVFGTSSTGEKKKFLLKRRLS